MMYLRAVRLLAGLTLTAVCTIQPFMVLAQAATGTTQLISHEGFEPDRILEDDDIFELGNMNQARIQEFLDAHGTLGKMRLSDTDAREKPVAEIIWRVATSYKINPRYLLALLQKEQSLVEDRHPSQKQLDWATGYGVCDSCSKDDPSIQDFKGFASQLEWSAKQHREKYLQQILIRGKTIAGYAPGVATTIDGQRLIPSNQATAMLYSYTPHIAGNLNLWRIWQRWFGLSFPDGTVVQAKSSKQIYLIRFGEKRPFTSRAVAASMIDPEKILLVDDRQLVSYPNGKPLAFANYSLVQAGDQRYLIDGQRKRLILSKKIFDRLGFNEDELIETTAQELSAYTDGPDITLASAYPTGLLAKDTKGTFWYVDGDTRHLIPHASLITLYFHSQPARTLTNKQLTAIPIGTPYQLHDGELVQPQKEKTIYVIENAARRPIPTGEVFEQMGWNWKNVVTLPESLLKQYPVGEAISPYRSPAPLIQTASAVAP